MKVNNIFYYFSELVYEVAWRQLSGNFQLYHGDNKATFQRDDDEIRFVQEQHY